jgi:Pvc16 N-terminal domain/Carboxypeptidase regulatory-like domain
MTLTVHVPLNTMLADLDEALRVLLKRELERHGFDGVEIAFEAPAKEWSATLSTPTVNLFLYDLREAADKRPIDWRPRNGADGIRELRPPLRMQASYAVTAWTRAVQDEHRLLSQVLAVLYAHPTIPDGVLNGTLAGQDHERFPLETSIGQARGDKSDFWSAVGGQYKASLDYVVLMACESGTALERGPEVRTQTIRLGTDAGRGTMAELHRVGGLVLDGDGAPVADAWVTLPDSGRFTASDSAGRFRFDRLTAGTYRCVARSADGREAEAELVVPGSGADLALRSARRRPKR